MSHESCLIVCEQVYLIVDKLEADNWVEIRKTTDNA